MQEKTILLCLNTCFLWCFVWNQPEMTHYLGKSNLKQIQFAIYPFLFAGIWSAIYKNKTVLKMYRFFLVAVLIFQFAHLTLCFLGYRHHVNRLDVAKMYGDLAKNPDNRMMKSAIDNIQRSYQCCGSKNPRFWPNNNLPLPDSCRRKNNYQYIYLDGCSRAYDTSLSTDKQYGHLMRFFSWGLAIVSAANIYYVTEILKKL